MYQLKRSPKRRTLAIKIKGAEVTVYAPNGVPDSVIDTFVASKAKWIEKHLVNQEARICDVLRSMTMPVFGEPCEIVMVPAAQSGCAFEDGKLTLYYSKRVKNLARFKVQTIQAFIDDTLSQYVSDAITRLHAPIGHTPSSVKIKSYKNRWGSCSSKGEITFNRELLLAPKWAVDYVVAHELAHLVHLNHSADFWQCVASMYPQRHKAEAYFANQALRLSFQE